MCSPTLVLIGGGLAAAGSIIGGINANSAAKARAKISRQNAARSDVNALTAANVGAVNRSRVARQNQIKEAEDVVAIATSGVEVASGTPLEVQVANATAGAVLELGEQFKTDQEVAGHRFKADSFRNEASAYLAQGKNAMTAGFINAGASLALSGFAFSQAIAPPAPGASTVGAAPFPAGGNILPVAGTNLIAR
tara:strand:+ start:1449 stop:2030 length:582 start_codon:yes stop_codon:yes gene_type:complete